MAEELMKRLAIEQRKRLVASILNAAESSPWWSRLSGPERTAYREKILSSIGVYHDFMLDVIKIGQDDPVNEYAIELISAVHNTTKRIEQRLGSQ